MGDGTNIGRVRGLGSAKHGSKHWIDQRVSAAGNILLTTWLFVSLFRLPNYDHPAVSAWLAQPLVSVAMILMMISVFWHIRLGLQVLIEDYVHEQGNKLFALMLLNFYVIGCAAIGIFMVAKHAFTGAPS
jgi:succinate dehydrogenase / fumarate reductase, membrane anchor subunit